MNRLTCSNVTTAKQTTSSQIGTKLRVSIEDKSLGGAKHPQIFDGIVLKPNYQVTLSSSEMSMQYSVWRNVIFWKRNVEFVFSFFNWIRSKWLTLYFSKYWIRICHTCLQNVVNVAELYYLNWSSFWMLPNVSTDYNAESPSSNAQFQQYFHQMIWGEGPSGSFRR